MVNPGLLVFAEDGEPRWRELGMCRSVWVTPCGAGDEDPAPECKAGLSPPASGRKGASHSASGAR